MRLKGLAHLVLEVVPVVNGRDAADGASRVVENTFDHVRLNAEPGAIGRERAAQIVDCPATLSRGAVEPAFQRAPFMERAARYNE